MPFPARDDDAGQATLEWVALVAAVAALLVVGGALAHGVWVGRAVTREIARGLCVVRGGDCARDREPCVLSADGERTGMTVAFTFVKLGTHQVGLLERRSDGRVAVTIGDDLQGGLSASAGAHLHAGHLSLTAEVEASEMALGEHAQTWVVGSPAAAAALVRAYEHRSDLGAGPLPPPDVTSGRLQLTGWAGATAEGEALVKLGSAGGGITLARDARTIVDHRSGHRTVVLEASASVDGEVHVTGVLDAGRQLAAAGGERFAVEFDAAGRPLDLRITRTGPYDGTADLPAVLSPVAGLLQARGPGERTFEVTAHLDLTDPASLAAAREVVGEVSEGRALAPAAGAALRERIARSGTVEARVLDHRHGGFDVDGGAGLGPQIRLGYEHDLDSTRLLAAVSRGLDGQWVPREDCVARA